MICECGHAKTDHHNAVEFCCDIAEAGTFCTVGVCTCSSFTARPDEEKGDKGLTAKQRLQKQIRELRSQLAAERTRRKEAEAFVRSHRELLEVAIEQWKDNHYEHCGNPLTGLSHGGDCHWPLPDAIKMATESGAEKQ